MKKKKLLVNLIKLFLSLVLLAILFSKLDIKEFIRAVHQLSNRILLVSIMIYLFSVFINAVKWKIVLPKYSINQLTKVCFKAQFFSVVLPGQLFGEIYKIGGIGRGESNKEEIASSVAMDKITGLLGTVIVGFSGILFCSLSLPFSILLCFFLAFLLLILLLVVSKCSIFLKVINFLVNVLKNYRYIKFRAIAVTIKKLYLSWISLFDKPRVLLKSILVGTLNQYIGIIQVFLLASNLDLPIGFMDYCWIMSGVSVILLIPISFAGIGLRDVSLVGFLSLYSVVPEKSMILSVALLIAQVASALVGCIIIVTENFKRNRNE